MRSGRARQERLYLNVQFGGASFWSLLQSHLDEHPKHGGVMPPHMLLDSAPSIETLLTKPQQALRIAQIEFLQDRPLHGNGPIARRT